MAAVPPILVLLLSAALLMLLLAASQPSTEVLAQSYAAPESSEVTETICRRSITQNIRNDGYTVVFRAVKKCRTTTKDSAFGELLAFGISSQRAPVVGFEAWRRQESETRATPDTRARFVMDRLIEYRDLNGVPGYQPGTADELVATLRLWRGAGQTAWSKPALTESTVTVDGVASKVYKLESGLSQPHPHVSEIKYGLLTAEAPVVATDPSGQSTDLSTKERQVVLAPSTVKVTLTVRNITYTQANTKLAIGTVLITKRGVVPRNASSSSSSSSTTPPLPDEPVDGLQEVLDVESDDPNFPRAGRSFFAWQPFLAGCTDVTGCKPKKVKVDLSNRASAGTAVDPATEESEFLQMVRSGDYAGFSVRRLFLSPSERVYDLVFDPTLGFTSGPVGTSSAGSLTAAMSVAVSVLAAAAALLVML